MKKALKKTGKILLIVLLALVVLAGAYVAYVLIDYHRISDNLSLSVSGSQEEPAQAGESYTLVSWNIGFGAYESDYSFFMDGGTQSWAWSPERRRRLWRIARASPPRPVGLARSSRQAGPMRLPSLPAERLPRLSGPERLSCRYLSVRSPR